MQDSVTQQAKLSGREVEVISGIADGLTHAQIGRALGISTHTVDTYVKRIRSKLNLGNKAQLAIASIHYQQLYENALTRTQPHGS